MNVGLYFGSFNPIHIGHLMVAEYMHSCAHLDEVWFIVSPQNPFKSKKDLLAERLRLEMVELAIGNNPKLKASDIEFDLPQPSYTFNTLEKLKGQYPKYVFSLIMGSDNLEFLNKWHRIEDILNTHDVHVYQRNNDILESPIQGNFIYHKAPQVDVSGTYIRQTIQDQKSIKYLVSQTVEEFIQLNNLYSGEE